ncbi:hypothetical protein JCM33374_g1016 [Metschnikowia sp. JCM 33374]|nr:hypothetical protein JCM33374_g1016 [Metschnikowia sp. JCM 33374]
MQTKVLDSITLNETEQKIKAVLVDFCTLYNNTIESENKNRIDDSQAKSPLELRITGGWVRDKLLGDESNDLDIAINVLSGEDFATQLMQWAQETGRFLGENATGLHTIKKNPEKSKHLETCTTKLFGLDIDFVNLRNESYTADSRVPIIEYGTAEQDAMRRDATLNALFYNINEDKIEDFTGRGLTDLQNGILRTPLPPLQTFLDDPLRVLRLVRFACRFNFTVEAETLEAMKNPEMKDTLIHKISRERVGVELHKILVSENVPYGLRLINHVNLSDCIFDAGAHTEPILQANEQSVIDDIELGKELVNKTVDETTQYFGEFVKSLSETPSLRGLAEEVFSSKILVKLFWLSVVLHPYGGIQVKIHAKKLSSMNYVEVVLKEGLRFGKTEYDTATRIAVGIAKNDFLADYFASPHSAKRSDVGLYMRNFNDYFNVNLVANAFHDFIRSIQPSELCTEVQPRSVEGVDFRNAKQTLAQYEQLLQTIEKLDLKTVKDTKPIIDGKLISKALQRKPGPWMKDIAPEVMRWQLDNPGGSAEECLEYIRGKSCDFTQ